MRGFGCFSLITIFVGLMLGIPKLSTSIESTVQNLSPTPELYNIVWSTQEIPCGALITKDMVELRATPLDEIPISPTVSLDRVVGKYTMQWIPKDVQVFPNTFSDTPVDFC